eukprot:scaffold5090_cov196-Alexandrium_tamarense.AAC.2
MRCVSEAHVVQLLLDEMDWFGVKGGGRRVRFAEFVFTFVHEGGQDQQQQDVLGGEGVTSDG